ncbi:DUF5412 domain-containing protein [Halalkalibacter akibai]|uniref:DUF5412 domain-containing protein n=1 Tax=Halalkalibacter akibai TaxID=1411 RepID=UPI000A66617A
MDHDYEDEKKKVYKKLIKSFFIGFLLITGLITYGVYWLFYDYSRFKQELIVESTSPGGTYTIKAYLNNGGATVSYTVLGELVFNQQNKRPKKIYWQYREENADIVWLDDQTVRINQVQLELPHQTYDYRRGVK